MIYIKEIAIAASALAVGLAIRPILASWWFEDFLTWLWMAALMLSVTPALIITSALALLFFATHHIMPATVMAILFLAGGIFRVTNGYGVGD